MPKVLIKINKKKTGMSLIEVSIALLIVGLSVPPLANLQLKLSRSTFNTYNSIDNIILMKNLYTEVCIKQLYKNQDPYVKNVGLPEKKLTYTSKPYKDYDNLLLEVITIENSTEQLVNLRFYPELSLGKKE